MRAEENPLVKELTDFKSLQDFVTANEGNLIDLTMGYYTMLGNDLGFRVKRMRLCQFENISLGSADLAWFDDETLAVLFEFEFGSREEMLAAVAKLLLSKPELAVLITSSRARIFSLEELKHILSELSFGMQQFLVIDLTKEQYIFVR